MIQRQRITLLLILSLLTVMFMLTSTAYLLYQLDQIVTELIGALSGDPA